MLASTIPDSLASESGLSAEDCAATLRRTCYGHLSLLRDAHVDVIPLRFAFVDNWLYFRATAELAEVVRQNPWMAISTSEQRGVTQFAGVVVRGGCYLADETGSAAGDAAALAGIIALRDRPHLGREEAPQVERTLRVYRMHADQIRGSITDVPCPPGSRPYDAAELSRLRQARMQQTVAEDARGDDDGMAAVEDKGYAR